VQAIPLVSSNFNAVVPYNRNSGRDLDLIVLKVKM